MEWVLAGLFGVPLFWAIHYRMCALNNDEFTFSLAHLIGSIIAVAGGWITLAAAAGYFLFGLAPKIILVKKRPGDFDK
ncbi:MAG: hypothetical protein V1806_16525 [Pseudomonadota bacterium]